MGWDVALANAVLTTTHVTTRREPVVEVSHELDEDGSVVWQFLGARRTIGPKCSCSCALDEILALAPHVAAVADSELGACAVWEIGRRKHRGVRLRGRGDDGPDDSVHLRFESSSTLAEPGTYILDASPPLSDVAGVLDATDVVLQRFGLHLDGRER